MQASAVQSRIRILLPVAAIAAVTVLLLGAAGGISVGHSNHAGLLPVVRRLLDPAYLPGDFHIALRWHHHKPFALLLAGFSAVLGESRGLIVLSILGKAAFASALWVYVRSCGLGHAAYLAIGGALALAVAGVGRGLEMNTLLGFAEIQPPVFAHAALFLALVAIAGSRWLATACCFGIAALFHVQIGILAALLLAPVVTLRLLRQRPPLRSLLPPAAVLLATFGIAALPALAAVSSGALGEGWDLAYVDFRMPHHFELRSPAALIQGIAGILLVAAAWRTRRGEPEEALLGASLALSVGIGLTSALHFLDYEGLRWGWIAKLQFIRLTPIVTMLGGISVVLLARHAWRAEAQGGHGARTALLGLVLAAGLAGAEATESWKRFERRFDLSIELRRESDEDLPRVTRFIREETPVDAVFLTPPTIEGFTVLADRSNVVEFKINPDGGLALETWYERMRDLAGGELPDGRGAENLRPLAAGFLRLPRDEIYRLRDKYGARYIVTSVQRRDLPPPLFHAGAIAVIDLGPPRPSD